MFSTHRDAVETLTEQSATTRRVLAAVPESAWNWKPHEKSRTTGELAWHLATGLRWFVADALKLSVPAKPAAAPANPSALLEVFDGMTRECLAAVKKQDDGWIKTKADFFGKPTTNGGILGMQVVHEAHHRAQLGLYVRINEGRVPPICGPTADGAS